MTTYTISHQAYVKTILHAAKHPHKPVNGVFLGKLVVNSGSSTIFVSDAVPLLHLWTSLSPMMEIGLDLARTHAESQGLRIVGYYQATEQLDDHALAPVGEKVASKIKDTFSDAFALVIDGEKLGEGGPALIPYIASGTTWRPQPSTFTAGSTFSLESLNSPKRALSLVQEHGLHRQFDDFDDHLENVSIDWLNNADCVDNGQQK
ncbi:UPF0172-domain-containing protein [Ramaria rubella]|nr:UPF0172-domain-containing protein [Ramaria rubella]